MSMMLVAYRPCGCRVGAVLDMHECPEVTAESRAEWKADGLHVREEEHESISARFCSTHLQAALDGRQE